MLGILEESLIRFDGKCVGFVLMPEHVHALLWFPESGSLSRFMQQWKYRSSIQIKNYLRDSTPEYPSYFSITDPIWYKRFYSFEMERSEKVEEKLVYIHQNPVRAGLVKSAVDWQWSSARWYENKRSVGVTIQWVD